MVIIEVWRGPPRYVQQVARKIFEQLGPEVYECMKTELSWGNMVEIYERSPIDAPHPFDPRDHVSPKPG